MQRAGIIPKRLAGTPAETFRVSDADAQKIMDAATPAEKAIAKAMQEHLVNSQLHTDANAASVRESGYEKLTEPGYWPRGRDWSQAPREVVESMRNFRDAMLKDMGFLKDAPGHASAPVLLEDAGDVFNRHLGEVARFAYLNDATRDLAMVMNDPAFKKEMQGRVGRQFEKQMTDTVQHLTGLEDHVEIPGARLLATIRQRIASGELMFRATSAVNHFLGGALAVTKMPEGTTAAFWKNFALKAVPDMNLIHDMESRNAYLRNRGTQSGANLETPVDTNYAAPGKAGRFLDKAGQVGTAHIRLSDRMDSSTVYKTLIEHFTKEMPGSTEDEVRNRAAKETEYVVRQTSTASTPFENSYFAQRVSRVPGLNLLTAMRNAIDEAFQDWRADKTPAASKHLIATVATVALMTAAYGAVGMAARKIKQGFQDRTKDEQAKEAESEAVQMGAHAADVLAPGVGGMMVRDVQAAIKKSGTNADIVTQTTSKAISDAHDAIVKGQQGDAGAAATKAVDALNGAGKLFGVSAEQPTQFAEGIAKSFDAPRKAVTHEQLVDHARAGEDVSEDLQKEVAEGRMTPKDAKAVMEKAQYPTDAAYAFFHADAKTAVGQLAQMSASKRGEPVRPNGPTYMEVARRRIEALPAVEQGPLLAKWRMLGGKE